jgi:teichuronic acid exporter
MSKEKAARAGAWSALDIVLRQGVQFVVSIVLARLLLPSDFGLIGLLTFFTALSITFVQGGLSMALIQRQDSSHEEESAVFWCNLGAALAFTLVLIVAAPWIARFYQEPLLHPLMFVASAQIVLSALGAVQNALLNRQLRFDLIMKTGILSSLVSGAVGIVMAVLNYGAWALAMQMLVMAAISTASLWWVSDWRPALRFRLASIRDLFGFGAFVSLSSILEVVHTNGFSLVIGKFYGVRDVGLLTRASGIQALPAGIISQIISRTALPLFAARAADPDALLRGFQLSVRLAMVVSVPMMVGLALLSNEVILILLGDAWSEAAPLLRVIAIGGILLPLHIFNLQLLLARGDSKQFLKLELQKKVLGVVFIGVGCFFGILGVAYATVVFSFYSLWINARPTKRDFGFGAIKQLIDLRGIFAAAAFMAGVVLALKWLVALPIVAKFVMLVAAGAIAYLCFGLLLSIQSFVEAREIAISLLRRRATTIDRSQVIGVPVRPEAEGGTGMETLISERPH